MCVCVCVCVCVCWTGTPYGGHYTACIADLLRAGSSGGESDDAASATATATATATTTSTSGPAGPQWYAFNDGNVTAIRPEQVAVQYGSKGRAETAYMLFYRRRALGAVPQPVPPLALQTRIAAENTKLLAERLVHDRLVNEVTLHLFSDQAVQMRAGLLVFTGADRSHNAPPVAPLDRPPADSSSADAKALANGSAVAVTVTLDGRLPLAHLYHAVATALGLNPQGQMSTTLVAAAEDGSSAGDAAAATATAGLRLLEQLQLQVGIMDTSAPDNVALYKLRTGAAKAAATAAVGAPYTIHDSGLKDHDRLLVFAGPLLAGHPPPYTQRNGMRLSINVVLLSTSPFVLPVGIDTDAGSDVGEQDGGGHLYRRTLVFVGEKDVSTVGDLFEFLSTHTGGQTATAFVWHQLKYNKLKDITGFVSAVVPHTLLSIAAGLADGTALVLEPLRPVDATAAGAGAETLAARDLRRQNSSVQLIVLHQCPEHYNPSGGADSDHAQLPIDIGTAFTLGTLKARALALIPEACRRGHADRGFRLRRIVGRDKEGILYTNEGLTVTEAELDENDLRVQLEHGPLPGPTQAEVRVSIKHPVTDKRSELVLLLDLRSTVKEVKSLLLSAADITDFAPTTFCLYRTDAAWDEKGKLFANENMSLEKLGIVTGDCLWLEQGAIPTKGLVNLDIYRYVPHKNSSVGFIREKLLLERGGGGGGDSSSSGSSSSSSGSIGSSSSSSGMSATPTQTVETASTAAPTVVADAPSDGSSVPDTSSATDTPSTTAAAAAVEDGAAEAETSSGVQRIFSIEAQSNDSLLEFKQTLHCQSALAHVPSINHLRVRLFKGHQVGKLVPALAQPLRKQGITSDRSVVVEILPTPDPDLSPHALMLQMYLGLPSLTSAGDVHFSLFPCDLLWDGGASAEHATLTTAVAAQTQVHT